MNRYDFDDAEFDELLQLTNDFVDGSAFFNAFIFLPDCVSNMLQTEVSNETMDAVEISKYKCVPNIRAYIYIYVKKYLNRNQNNNKLRHAHSLSKCYVHCFQNSELNLKKKVSEKVYKYICDQIDEHEKTFDNDNIRDFVDHYWRTKKFGEENERKYLTSQYSACKEYV